MPPVHARHYNNALDKIPWATQTNAKRWQDDMATMPPFIQRAQGCRIWDLDDKEYIDFRCALGPIILGYRYSGERVPVGKGKVDWQGQLRALVQHKLIDHVTIETHCEPLIENSRKNLSAVRKMLTLNDNED